MSTPKASPALVLAALIALAATATRSNAAWIPDGVPLSPAATGLQSYYIEGLAADGSDGAYLVWQFMDPLPDLSGTAYTLAAQRVDLLGDLPAPWSLAGVTIRSWLSSSSFGTYAMDELRLLDDGAGGAILPAIDHQNSVEIMHVLRLYHVQPGAAVSPIALPTTSGGYPVLSAGADADGSGGVVMIGVGQTFSPPVEPLPPSPLFAQRVNAAGTPSWPSGSAPGPELVPAGQAAANGVAALSDGAGGAFFAWSDLREAGDPDLYVQHLDAGGAIAGGWPAGGVQVCGVAGDQSAPSLCSNGAGGVIVMWADHRTSTPCVYASALDASGALVPGIPADGLQVPTSGPNGALVALASDGQGGCLVVVGTLLAPFHGAAQLHRLDGALQPRAGWPATGITLNVITPGVDAGVGLLADGLGGAFVSYSIGTGSDPADGLYAQHFAGDGTLAPGWTSAGYRLSATGSQPRIVRSGAGAIVAWTDSRGGGSQVFAQRLVTDGPVPTQMALVRASATASAVTLRWFASGAAALRATVERRDATGGWSALADVVADGSGFVDYVDRAVTPGARYGYRLSWSEDGAMRITAESWITVPASLALAIEPPRPNPASGPVMLALTLTDGGAARLDVLDLTGRRVIARDLAGLGAGRHLVVLDEAASLAPGVYALRLTAGGDVRLAKLCVMR